MFYNSYIFDILLFPYSTEFLFNSNDISSRMTGMIKEKRKLQWADLHLHPSISPLASHRLTPHVSPFDYSVSYYELFPTSLSISSPSSINPFIRYYEQLSYIDIFVVTSFGYYLFSSYQLLL